VTNRAVRYAPKVSALPAVVNLTAYRGDSWQQPFVLKDSAGNPVDLTNSTAAAWATPNQNGGGHIVLPVTVGPDPGTVTLGLPPSAPAGAYQYDLELTNIGVVTTWIRGRLIVEQDITNAA